MVETTIKPRASAKPKSKAGAKPRTTARGPREKWKVQVDVYLEDDTTDPPRFRIETCLPCYDAKPGDKIMVFNNNGRPGFEIHFHLHDLTMQGYRFARSRDDAVWSRIGDDCPTTEAHEVFEVERVVEPDGTMLVVRNENDRRNNKPLGRFRYTLNVTTTGREPYLPLDPGGDDLNGPRTLR